jgi:predicted nucleic acid-binding protein
MAIQRTNATFDMKLIITDTNVFFDIISIGALSEFFALDFEICTTDFVVNEVLESDQKMQIESFIKTNKLLVFKLSAEEVEEIKSFTTKRFFKGITDKTVLWKSYQLKCPLLTGDKKLRNEADDLKIEVHGSIWVINELIEKEIITKIKGIELLEKIKLINASLPHDEIDKIINWLKIPN